ncbi:MAG: phosphohydrolase [Moraxellaceae bacterium]|jgi:hypothetical protein|nr:phosphohydrolase [Moraxellaceae bacterium]
MSTADVRAWVRLPSGKRLDLLNPTPFDWDDEDLAIGLARTYRWGGHSAWPLPLSVAQHSLTVLELARAAKHGLTPDAELRELLHDADEGLLGFDAISVIKPFLGEGFHALAGRLQDVVFQRYALTYWSETEKEAHKRVDRVAAASEALHVAGWERAEVRQVLKISYKPLDTDPLVAIYGGTPWEPWAPDVAADRFLKELQRIQSRR